MKFHKKTILIGLLLGQGCLLLNNPVVAQYGLQTEQKLDPVVENIVKEAKNNSQLERLAFELLDVIGPRLVGTPQMAKANDWAVETFQSWGIEAEKQQFGEWRGWQRGISHIDMVYPHNKTLAGTQL